MNPIFSFRRRRKHTLIRLGALALITPALAIRSAPQLAAASSPGAKDTRQRRPLYTFTLTHDGTPEFCCGSFCSS